MFNRFTFRSGVFCFLFFSAFCSAGQTISLENIDPTTYAELGVISSLTGPLELEIDSKTEDQLNQYGLTLNDLAQFFSNRTGEAVRNQKREQYKNRFWFISKPTGSSRSYKIEYIPDGKTLFVSDVEPAHEKAIEIYSQRKHKRITTFVPQFIVLSQNPRLLAGKEIRICVFRNENLDILQDIQMNKEELAEQIRKFQGSAKPDFSGGPNSASITLETRGYSISIYYDVNERLREMTVRHFLVRKSCSPTLHKEVPPHST
ncbi:MAG: hypothetical protein AB7F43_09585 [Bacteriovoracia bacterium]